MTLKNNINHNLTPIRNKIKFFNAFLRFKLLTWKFQHAEKNWRVQVDGEGARPRLPEKVQVEDFQVGGKEVPDAGKHLRLHEVLPPEQADHPRRSQQRNRTGTFKSRQGWSKVFISVAKSLEFDH